MEQKQIYCGLPPLSAKYPWLVSQNLRPKEEEHNILFCTMRDPLSHYRCRIPELIGKRIQAYFHGWVILSNYPQNNLWFLWNPSTSKRIHFPPLILKDRDYKSIEHCCLSSPPNDPTSVLMLLRTKQRTIVFCRVDRKKKRLKWKEMAYDKQVKSIHGGIGFIRCITCCNGKVYALYRDRLYQDVIHIDIVVKGKEVVINISQFSELPSTPYYGDFNLMSLLKGCYTELFLIELGFDTLKNTPAAVCVYKLDLKKRHMIWEEVKDLKNAIFLVDSRRDGSASSIASDLGGYIHVLGTTGQVIYSYNVKDNTISPSYSLTPTSHVSLWECGLQSDIKREDKIMVRDEKKVDIITTTRNEPNEKNSNSRILNILVDLLGMIMERCVGVEYLNFRASCKHILLQAPMIHWSNKTQVIKLQSYSLVSPWLMAFDKHQGHITFTDPMFGNKYFVKTPPDLVGDLRVRCCNYGWLVLFKVITGPVVLYNPFTKDIRELPYVTFLQTFSLSAPPSSPDCMLVGFTPELATQVYLLFLNRDSAWRRFRMDFGGPVPRSFRSPTFYDGDVYALIEGRLGVFREINQGNCVWDVVVAEAPSNRVVEYYLVKCDAYHLLLVMVDEFGKSVEVFKLHESKKQWEKLDSLGKHMIYICDATCLCVEAKTPEMENKIYFPRLHPENGKIVFYSLETRKYHTFNGRNIQASFGDLFRTGYICDPHAWIEPSWCQVH